jgi:hypothetical protein
MGIIASTKSRINQGLKAINAVSKKAIEIKSCT